MDSPQDLDSAVRSILSSLHEMDVSGLRKQLRSGGIEIERRALNRHLYSSRRLYASDGGARGAPRWRLLHVGHAALPVEGTPTEQVRLALRSLSERDREIYIGRRLRRTKATLENLGTRFDITRERVRQIEKKAAQRLGRVRQPEYTGDGIRRLEDALPPELTTPSVTEELVHGMPYSEDSVVAAILLELRGDLIRARFVGSADAWRALQDDIDELASGTDPPISFYRRRVERHLPGVSSPDLALLLSELEAGRHNDPSAPKALRRTNADRILDVLEHRNEPMTKAEIADATALIRVPRTGIGECQHIRWNCPTVILEK